MLETSKINNRFLHTNPTEKQIILGLFIELPVVRWWYNWKKKNVRLCSLVSKILTKVRTSGTRGGSRDLYGPITRHRNIVWNIKQSPSFYTQFPSCPLTLTTNIQKLQSRPRTSYLLIVSKCSLFSCSTTYVDVTK